MLYGRGVSDDKAMAAAFTDALIRYRVRVEVEYFIALCELPLPELKGIGTTAFERLAGLVIGYSVLYFTLVCNG